MLLTRQQIKAKKRNAKRLGQLLQDARQELVKSIAMLEDTTIEEGIWQLPDVSGSHKAHSAIGQILAIANQWNDLNHFEIEEKLSLIENTFYQH
jgi:RNA polymerase-interacting CarD/CdnL/TRCF family regulator